MFFFLKKSINQDIKIRNEMKNLVVLVTGGKGLVGQSIEEELKMMKKNGAKVFNKELEEIEFVYLSSKDADLTDINQTRNIFQKYQPDYVINLAAHVGGLYANMNDADGLFYRINMAINQNVITISSEFKVNKCISCLSTCIFPDKIECPLDETKIHLGPPHVSNIGYSMAKRQVDLLNKQYNKSPNNHTLFTAIIPTNIYGRFDNFNLKQSHVIPGLIHKAYLSVQKALSTGSKQAILEVSGSGKSLRQFIYAPDLAKLIIWALETYDDKEPLILSPDETDEISISEAANIIVSTFSRRFNIDVKIQYNTTQCNGQYKKTATNSKLRSFLPEFEFTPFVVGVREVVEWFCDNYPNIRKDDHQNNKI